MENIIRKIVIGPDIVNGGMNYRVGQTIRQREGQLEISDIIVNDNGSHSIFVVRDGEKFEWKRVSLTTPTTVEYSIEF